jgi:hypothetical protein
MEFTLNYSPQAAALLDSGAIALDRFKCPPWRDLAATAQSHAPVYIHFDLIAGGGLASEVDWAAVEQWLIDTDTPYVNLHLLVPSGTPDDIAFERMVADIRAASAVFGADRVICENIPYRPQLKDEIGGEYARFSIEPETIRRVLEETGTGLLLDLAHARITASSIGADVFEYVRSLPLERLTEVHITGLGDVNGMISDHMPMQDPDWALFDWMIGLIHSGAARMPWAVSCEYGGVSARFQWRSDPEVIRAQIPRMVAAVQGVRA